LALRKDSNALRLAQAVRQHRRSPHHLVPAARVHLEADVSLNGLWETSTGMGLLNSKHNSSSGGGTSSGEHV
jgi:hypothetical protein